MTKKKANPNQKALLDVLPFWKTEWEDMPEFVQEDLTSKRAIIVHFRNDEDVKAFADLIGQDITPKQKSLWHPELEFRVASNKRYEDEP